MLPPGQALSSVFTCINPHNRPGWGMDFYHHYFAERGYPGLERLCHFPRVPQLEGGSRDFYPQFTDEKAKTRVAPIMCHG